MSNPSYPLDRASVVARGLINMRGQVKSTQTYLATMQTLLAKYEQGSPAERSQAPEFLLRIVNLEDVLRVLAVYIELGEQEQSRLTGQLPLFEESEGTHPARKREGGAA